MLKHSQLYKHQKLIYYFYKEYKICCCLSNVDYPAREIPDYINKYWGLSFWPDDRSHLVIKIVRVTNSAPLNKDGEYGILFFRVISTITNFDIKNPLNTVPEYNNPIEIFTDKDFESMRDVVFSLGMRMHHIYEKNVTVSVELSPSDKKMIKTIIEDDLSDTKKIINHFLKLEMTKIKESDLLKRRMEKKGKRMNSKIESNLEKKIDNIKGDEHIPNVKIKQYWLNQINEGKFNLRHIEQNRTGESNLLMCDEIWDEMDDSWSTNPHNINNKGRFKEKGTNHHKDANKDMKKDIKKR